jgi:hypothetical protein
VVDALAAEVSGENAPVGGETGECDPRVVGDAEDLALVRGELGGRLVGGGEDGAGAGAEADAGGALLHGLHRVLRLEDPSMEAERRHVGVVLVPEHSRTFYCCPLRFFPHDLGISVTGQSAWGIGSFDFTIFEPLFLHGRLDLMIQ